MSAEEIHVVDNPAAGRLEVRLGAHVAFAEYRLLASGILFPHTEVPEALGGKGIGSMLVKAGLAMAREKGLKVMPVCPFFASYMTKHPETHDLLHPDYRAALGL